MRKTFKITSSFVFITALLLMPECFFPQNRDADSIKVILRGRINDTVRASALSELCFVLSENYPLEAIQYGEEALLIAQKAGNKNCEGLARMHLGNAYRNYSDYEKALACFEKAKSIYRTLGSSEKELMVLMNEATVHWNRGDLDQAIQINLDVLKMAEQKNYPKMQSIALNNAGLAFTDKRDYKKGINYFEKSLIIHRKYNLSDSANEYQNIGNGYYFLGDFEKAKKNYETALAIYTIKNDIKGKMRVLTNLGNIYLETGDVNAAKIVYSESAVIAEKLNDKVQLASLMGNLAYVYIDLSDITKALECCKKGLVYAKELKSKKITENLYFIYAEVCEALGDFECAYRNLLSSSKLRDSIYNDERDRSVREMETKYETEKKDSQIKLLNSEKQKQKIILVSVISGLVLLGIFFWVLYTRFRLIRSQKKVIEVQKTETEMQKHIIEEKQKEILDSIYYAQRIQKAMMPSKKHIDKSLQRLKE